MQHWRLFHCIERVVVIRTRVVDFSDCLQSSQRLRPNVTCGERVLVGIMYFVYFSPKRLNIHCISP